ncbi:MAG: tetratricopeptide repeat protein [Xanthomonadales bacterium]|nr:tetratricopeptide repeat protein [Xanthomonadales bacterium]
MIDQATDELALEHYQAGRYGEAETLLREMLDEEPDNAQLLFLLALTRQQQRDLDEPLPLLERAIRVQPQNATLHYALGSLHLRRGQPDPAEAAFYKATDIDPNYVEALNGIAFVALAREDYAAAESVLRKSLKSEPEQVDALTKMGIAQLGLEQVEDATRTLQQAVDRDPDQPAAQYHLGRALLAAGNAGFAVQCFENARRQWPDVPDVLRSLAAAQDEAGQHDDAVDSWRRLLNVDGESWETMAGLAAAERRTGNLEAARNCYLRALKLKPDHAGASMALARLEADMGRWQDARRRLSAVVEANDDAEAAQRLLAECHLALGEPEPALDVVRSLTARGVPDDDARWLLVRTLLANGEREAGDAQLDRLLEAERPRPDAVLLRAEQWLDEDRLDDAEPLLRQLQRRHDLTTGQRVRSIQLLGDALHRAGRYQNAWEQYISLPEKPPEFLRAMAERSLVLADAPAETAMTREIAWSWPPQPPEDGHKEPIFVFGWPGSGRERLLRALAAHPDLALVDDEGERQSERRQWVTYPRGAEALNGLRDADIRLARRRYARQLRGAAERGRIVDAMWLPVEALPTLYRYFPQAHVLVLKRDADDLALAWLRSGYPDREQLMDTWQAQLDLLTRCEENVPLNYLSLEADALERDPESGLQDLLTALGTRWSDDVLEAWNADPEARVLRAGDGAHYRQWLGDEGGDSDVLF